MSNSDISDISQHRDVKNIKTLADEIRKILEDPALQHSHEQLRDALIPAMSRAANGKQSEIEKEVLARIEADFQSVLNENLDRETSMEMLYCVLSELEYSVKCAKLP